MSFLQPAPGEDPEAEQLPPPSPVVDMTDVAKFTKLAALGQELAEQGNARRGTPGELAAMASRVLAKVSQTEDAAHPLRRSICRFTADELRSVPPPMRYVLKPYIPAGTVTNLAGPGGQGKTTWTVNLAVCRALGLPFMGHPTFAEGRTVILTTEDSRDDYHRKLAALRHELGSDFDADRVADQVVLLDLAGVPVRMVEADKGNYRPTPFADELADVLRTELAGTELVIMETVSRLAGGVETNESLSILVESAQRVCRLAGVAVLLVSHVSQDAGRNGTADQYAPRGGSAIGDNGRSTIVLTRLADGNLKKFAPDAEIPDELADRLLVLNHAKSNGAACADPVLLERHSTPHGPVLRMAVLKPKKSDLEAQIDRLLTKAREMATAGMIPTEKKLKAHARWIGCPERGVGPLIEVACDRGSLEPLPEAVRGGGVGYRVTGAGSGAEVGQS